MNKKKNKNIDVDRIIKEIKENLIILLTFYLECTNYSNGAVPLRVLISVALTTFSNLLFKMSHWDILKEILKYP